MDTQKFIRSVSQGRREIFMIPHTRIIPKESFNKRKDFGNIKALAMSILSNPEGIKETVRVKINKDTNTIELINGERRYRACQWLVENGHEAPLMPCRFEPATTTDKELLIGQAVMNAGKPMDMLEKAAIYLDLMELHDMNGQQIADRLETTKAAVSNGIILIRDGAPKVIKMIQKGQISASAALEVIKKYKTNHASQESKILDLLSTTNKPSKAKAKKSVSSKNDDDSKTTSEGTGTSSSTTQDTSKPPDWKKERKEDDAANKGSGGGGGGTGTANLNADKRIAKIDKMMEELNLDKAHPERVASFELLLNYLSGEVTTITPLKKHLQGK